MVDELRLTMEQVDEHFNLDEYEIGAYLAVLEHGQLTAGEIADRTSIPQPQVYDTARSPSDRGLVELRESRLVKVVAVDPDDTLTNVKTSLEEPIEELEVCYTALARDAEAVPLVRLRSTILRYIEEIIEAAEYEFVFSLTPDLFCRFHDDLAAAIDSGVNIDLLVTPASRAPDSEEFNHLDVATITRARRDITSPVLVVVGDEYSIYATQGALRDDCDRYGIIFNRSALGFFVSGFSGTVLWSTAETITANGKRRPFPRRYASIRRAVEDIREIEGDFYASVSGRDIEIDDPIVVERRVIETAFEDTEEVVSLHIETEEGIVEVGGLVTMLEDVEGQEILLGCDEVPNRDEIV